MKAPLLTTLGLALAMAVLASASAQAQATRTWVSGVGDDANPCSRTAPCKTFAGAISKTAAGGDINCIDPGGFGAITITKSITIDCTGTFGSILASGTNGVIVNAANVNVTLRNLSIDGSGSVLGVNGVRFLQSGNLRIENVNIFNFSGVGIDFVPTAGSELFVTRSDIYNIGNGASTGAINIVPAAGSPVVATIDRSSVQNNNSGAGVRINTATSNALAALTVRESSITGNTFTGVASAAGGAALLVAIHQSSVNLNGTGVTSDGTNSTVRIGTSIVSGNNTGLTETNSGKIISFSSNILSGNLGSDGSPTSTVPSQ